MRISDWSSDVCSSDLKTSHLDLPHRYIPWPIPGFQFCRNTIAWGITTHRYGIPGVCAAVLIYDVDATGGDWGHGTPVVLGGTAVCARAGRRIGCVGAGT